MSEELKKYMFLKPIGWIISACVFTSLTIAFIIATLAGSSTKPIGIVVFLAGAVVSVLFIIRNVKHVEKFQNDQVLCRHLNIDFNNAITMRKGRIKFGDKWIFIKNKGYFLRYEEITQIYQYIHKTNFIEDERSLKYVDTKGKHRVLCKLELHDKSKDEAMQILSIICSRNPRVTIGYR